MNKFLILLLFVAFLSCSKDRNPVECEGYSAAIFKAGYAYAEGSYEDFGDYAIFARELSPDSIEFVVHDEIDKSFLLTKIDHWCHEKIKIYIKNIDLSITDTIKLFYSRLGLSREFPTGAIRFMDADALIETYHLLEDADNWVIIDKVNPDSTEVEGRFQMSFITSREVYLNNERERWDDPNRPNILHFTNGKFRAVFRDF
jgi:hypothetical protein